MEYLGLVHVELCGEGLHLARLLLELLLALGDDFGLLDA
jgi:hypothetical protein